MSPLSLSTSLGECRMQEEDLDSSRGRMSEESSWESPRTGWTYPYDCLQVGWAICDSPSPSWLTTALFNAST